MAFCAEKVRRPLFKIYMKVLHINQSDIMGGAAIAGYRLHQALLNSGVDSRLFVAETNLDDPRIREIPQKRRTQDLLRNISDPLGLNFVNIVSTFLMPQDPFFQEAEIVNFHNIHRGYFNYLALPQLTKNKPGVFVLHDMWTFTGHCVYSYDCDRWKIGCGQCPYPETYPSINRDNTHVEWRLKQWLYQQSNLSVVSPSRWLIEQVQQSPLLQNLPLHHIPHGIDTEAYQPLDPEMCRAALGIPTHKKVLMFVADLLQDYRKGSDLLLEALSQLPDSLKVDTILLTLGLGSESFWSSCGLASINMGVVRNDRLKSVIYSAADLFVFATRADIFGLVLQESMACGTPMISFKIGGVPDLVRPGITGYLAEPENSQDLCQGIIYLLEDNTLRQQMSQHCRDIALNEYSLDKQAQRYLEVYNKILGIAPKLS
ncbi:glycosyl transferase, group 1 [Crocosphaera subtropica ATCC 51142]|uniref:Glycosyl transferase, group 1 n=2 Tax=Crocosphaera TaxID=263510 RepID=B1WNL8_CROS5|nr:glycosyl transferase, group 1 [Crocosphaera subtropica ATCC 51142]